MTLTVVLDGGGLHAWSRPLPPPQVLTLMELIRRHGSGRVIVPSVVTVEVLGGGGMEPEVERSLRALRVETELSLDQARAAAGLRDGLAVSAADAVVAESVIRHRADVVVTSDPEDLRALLDRTSATPHIIVVDGVGGGTRGAQPW